MVSGQGKCKVKALTLMPKLRKPQSLWFHCKYKINSKLIGFKTVFFYLKLKELQTNNTKCMLQSKWQITFPPKRSLTLSQASRTKSGVLKSQIYYWHSSLGARSYTHKKISNCSWFQHYYLIFKHFRYTCKSCIVSICYLIDETD